MGLYANDLVEVTGDLQQGDKVVVRVPAGDFTYKIVSIS